MFITTSLNRFFSPTDSLKPNDSTFNGVDDEDKQSIITLAFNKDYFMAILNI